MRVLIIQEYKHGLNIEEIMLDKILNQVKDPLYKNSFYLILSSLIAAGLGLIFWIIAARLYTPEDLGLATAIISAVGFITLLSRLGFEQSIIRFFPERDKNEVFSTSLYITTIFSILIGCIFIIGIPIWSPKLYIVYSIIPLFLIVLTINSFYSIATTALIALRRASIVLLQNVMNGTRFLFLFIFVSFGAVGIFGSVGIALFIALLIPVVLFFHHNLHLGGLDIGFIRNSLHFSVGNFISTLFLTLPIQILPIIILNLEGPKEAAIYSITFSISSLLMVIPNSFSMSLFVEGSYGRSLKRTAFKSFSIIFGLLIPSILFLFLFGDILLGIMGQEYIQGFFLMKMMAVSMVFYSFFIIFLSIKKVQKDIKGIMLFSGMNFLVILGLSYTFLLNFGVLSIGFAWLIGYIIICCVILIIVITKKYVIKIMLIIGKWRTIKKI